MTYTELTQAIQDFATNYEPSFISHIDQFIIMTEHRIYMEASLPVEQSSTALVLDVGVSTIDTTSIPGYIAVDSLAIVVGGENGAYYYLDNKEEEYLRTAFPSPTTLGRPRLYNVYDNKTLKLAPTPDQAYPAQLRYSSYPPSLTTTLTTTWLSTNFEFALLYGAMRDAAIYLKEEPDVVAMYENKYTEAVNEIKNFGDTKASLDSYRKRG